MNRLVGLFLSTAVLLSAACASAADTVKIGAVYALTGAGAVAGSGLSYFASAAWTVPQWPEVSVCSPAKYKVSSNGPRN